MDKENRKKKRIRGWIIAAVIVLVIAGAVVFISSKTPKGTPVDTEAASVMDLEQTVEIRGTVTGSDTADVYSKSSNRISKILVKEGDRVKAGDKLALLEGDSSAILYNKAKIALENAEREYENSKKLYEAGGISKENFIKAETAYKDAELSLKQINTEDDACVTSPIDGTVTRVYTSVGKLAGGANASSLFVVENIDQLQMVLRVSEYDISKVKKGQPVRISSEVLGKDTVSGTVESIAPTGEAKAQGSSEMVVPVTIKIDPDQTGLFAGINAKAAIITGKTENALVVPVDSVMEDEDGSFYVFAAEDGVLSKRAIKVVLEGDLYTAIEKGQEVSEGDQIVLSPDYSLEDGEQVMATEK